MIALADGSGLGKWIGTLVVVLGVGLMLVHAQRVIEKRARSSRGLTFGQQLAMLGLSFLSLLVVVIALPVEGETRGQLLSFFGIVLSAAIALSSTTLLGNAMAGITLRAVRGFRVGDFIRSGDHFGRVTELGLVHTEIQTEDRDLTTLPNLFLATQPVRVIRNSGTILSAEVSLGYDIPRARVQECLSKAASSTGLEDPFVSIQALGDFSVVYRIAGLCKDVNHLISTRSRLRAEMLDALHGAGIEIVSPAFMSTRAMTASAAVIPEEVRAPAPSQTPENVIFDKAEEATTIERLKQLIGELEQEIEEKGESEELKAQLLRRKEQVEAMLDDLKDGSAEKD